MFFSQLPNELALQRKYIGHGHAIRRYRQSIRYAEQQVLETHEQVLCSIAVQAPPQFHQHMYGLLVATSQRLLFITASKHYGSLFDVYPYDSLMQVSMRRAKKIEILLRFRRMDKCFIVPYVDERLTTFRQTLKHQIASYDKPSN